MKNFILLFLKKIVKVRLSGCYVCVYVCFKRVKFFVDFNDNDIDK